MNINSLIPFIPNNSLLFIEKWLHPFAFIIKIKRERRNKLGDYRKPLAGKPHIITLNNNMGKELCFLTLTHEISHLIAFDLYKNKAILSHGIEWKKVYGEMIRESLSIYSKDLQQLLIPFSKKPKAGFFSDKKLAYYFLKLDNPHAIYLKDINIGEKFSLGRKYFIKGEKSKIRYICKEILSGKKYLVSPLVPINQINEK